jgi:hypothetical protein
MIELLRKPLPPAWLLLISLGVTVAVALYCTAYAGFAGRAEPPADALAWAIVNILPWFLAFEVGKRLGGSGQLAVLGLALIASLGLHFALNPALAPAFELVRRLPALATIAALLVLVSRFGDRRAAGVRSTGELPLAPDQIDWVSAAGNYVELHGRGRTIIHRASLSSLEGALADHGFVRVHRSTLVRRTRIARVRPSDLILHDGTSIRTGKRFRSAIH